MGPRLPLLALSLALPPPWLLADGGGGSDELGELSSWLTEGGADLSAVMVGAGVSGERGVVTTRALAAGEVILRVPVPKAINVGPMSVTAGAPPWLLSPVHIGAHRSVALCRMGGAIQRS